MVFHFATHQTPSWCTMGIAHTKTYIRFNVPTLEKHVIQFVKWKKQHLPYSGLSQMWHQMK